MLGTDLDRVIAERNGRAFSRLPRRREKLGTPRLPPAQELHEDSQLGTAPNAQVARRLGRSKARVVFRRAQLGIANHERHAPLAPRHTWTAEENALLGMVADAIQAQLLGCAPIVAFNRRQNLACVGVVLWFLPQLAHFGIGPAAAGGTSTIWWLA